MITKLQPNRVRRTYLGGGRIDAFCGVPADVSDGVPRPEEETRVFAEWKFRWDSG